MATQASQEAFCAPDAGRRACFGELVQIDGSDHDWFEGRGARCSLLVYIDDATGELLELWFVPEETFFGYCEASRHYFDRYGKPVAFYSDKHGIFRGLTRSKPLAWGVVSPLSSQRGFRRRTRR